MNAIFVANKPAGMSSNHFLGRLKRKYGVKKAGFSGTLDPFASGCLIVAFGSYTKFFRFLDKSPKVYEATIWLGASSPSMDNENITEILNVKELNLEKLEAIRAELIGKISYVPPKFSAKHINGTRAYKLARSGEEFELKPETMEIYESQILNYSHPFLTLRLSVSEGSYIRSYAEIFGQKVGYNVTLSSLKRVSEGKFRYENEKFLNICNFLNIEQNTYFGDISNILDGKKLKINDFETQTQGIYLLNYDKFMSVIQIMDDTINYTLNKVEKC